MNYDFKVHSKKQIILDKYILDNNKSISKDKYWEFRVTALNVELSEVMNEIRFFKFWSKKGPSDKDVILEEWVDCLHFILSLGNTLKNDNFKYEIKSVKKSFNELYIDLEKNIISLYDNQLIKTINSIVFILCEISFKLNFSMKDINLSYNKKNKLNFHRQEINY